MGTLRGFGGFDLKLFPFPLNRNGSSSFCFDARTGTHFAGNALEGR
jgi:hypothetical protein